MIWRFLAVSLVSVGFLGGCSNPATQTPEAVVSEAAAVSQDLEPGVRYRLTENSVIGFMGSKVHGNHPGGFNEFTGEIVLVDDDPTRSRVEVTIDTGSVWSDEARLTDHLRTSDFFDVPSFPVARFTSTAVERVDAGFEITGNLDLRGVSKSITIPAEVTVEPERITARADFHIKRFDYGIEYPGKANDLIRDEVLIHLEIEAIPAT